MNNTQHTGTFMGRSSAHHGMSRAHQCIIVTDRGGEIFSDETPDIQAPARITFEHGINKLGENVAVNVTPIAAKTAEPPKSPVTAARRSR
jgi:hypothetical protein